MEEVNTIYVKEEDIPKSRTRKKFLKDFMKNLPKTYTDQEYKTIQCNAKKHRSLSDLIAIVKSRFSKTSLKAIVRIVDELNINNECDIVYCTQVNKFVVRGNDYQGNSKNLITSYSNKYFKDQRGIDGLSFKEIMEIRQITKDEKIKKEVKKK